jgi:mono/diheme cytochrome c family protein
MPKISGFLFPLALLTGMLLAGCGAFDAAPTATSTAVPTSTRTTVPPTQIKVPTATLTPLPTATGTPLPQPTVTDTPAAGLDGKTLLEQRCNACHSSEYVTGLRGTVDQWAGLVDNMVQNGADLSPQEAQTLAAYLGKTYHP